MCGTEYLRWMYWCNKRKNNTGCEFRGDVLGY